VLDHAVADLATIVVSTTYCALAWINVNAIGEPVMPASVDQRIPSRDKAQVY
jgi:hypothetical protein